MERHLLKEPSSYRQLIRYSWNVNRFSFRKVVLLSFLASVIIFLPRLIYDFTGYSLFGSTTILSAKYLWILLFDFCVIILLVGIFWHIHCVMFGIKDPLIQDVKMGLRKLLYVIVANFIQVVLVVLSICIVYVFQYILMNFDLIYTTSFWGAAINAIIFGIQIAFIIYVASLFIFYIPIIATENKGILDALKRSISLVWNHSWRTISVQITPIIIYTLIYLVVRFLLGIINSHVYGTEYFVQPAQEAILHITMFTIFIPWVASLLLVQLHDLELRKKLAN